VEKVGVFVEHSASEIRTIAEQAKFSGVQIHGGFEHQPTRLVWDGLEGFPLKRRIWALPSHELSDGLIASESMVNSGRTLLIDSGNRETPGGTGKTFDWTMTQLAFTVVGKIMPAIVAGGLTASNVSDAMRILYPFGVDVSSGVELRPGKKDPGKVRAFVRAVREADQKAS